MFQLNHSSIWNAWFQLFNLWKICIVLVLFSCFNNSKALYLTFPKCAWTQMKLRSGWHTEIGSFHKFNHRSICHQNMGKIIHMNSEKVITWNYYLYLFRPPFIFNLSTYLLACFQKREEFILTYFWVKGLDQSNQLHMFFTLEVK